MSQALNIIPMPQLDTFTQFWQAYPRRVAKKDAEKAWAVAIKLASPELIIAAVENQKQNCEQWHKDGGQFIPYPASWLRGQRWEDDCQPIVIGSAVQTASPMQQRIWHGELVKVEDAIRIQKGNWPDHMDKPPEVIAEIKRLRAIVNDYKKKLHIA